MPRRTRDRELAEYRRAMPPGSLILDQQLQGLLVAESMLGFVRNPHNHAKLALSIAACGLNTASYLMRNSQTQRSRLKLPVVAIDDEGGEWRQDFPSLKEKASAHLASTAELAFATWQAHVKNHVNADLAKRQLGREVGNASLELSAVSLGYIPAGSAADIQNFMREQGLFALEQARTAHGIFGSHPTLAQLGDPDSDLGTWIRREASDDVYEAYEQALADQRVSDARLNVKRAFDESR